MNPERRELLRENILQILEERASDRFGLAAFAIQIRLGQYGFRGMKLAEINTELQYLADKQLVTPVGKVISPENTCWRITAAGRDLLATNKPNDE